MKEVNISKAKLLAELKDNLDKHRNEFEELWYAYKEEAVAQLKKRTEEAEKTKLGENIHHYINLPAPVDHSEDYEQAIQMLEWEKNDTVSLTAREFEQFINDNWDWKREHLANSQTYLAGKFG